MSEQQEVMMHSPGFILGVPSSSAFSTCRVTVDGDNTATVHPLGTIPENVGEPQQDVQVEQRVNDASPEDNAPVAFENVVTTTQPAYYANGG